MIKRTDYEAPLTERFLVELEGTFCASSEIENPNKESTGLIEEHETGFSADFSSDWNEVQK
jgi:hypothetical protein